MYIYRSAKTGKIVTEKYAKANPDTVIREKVKEEVVEEVIDLEPQFEALYQVARTQGKDLTVEIGGKTYTIYQNSTHSE